MPATVELMRRLAAAAAVETLPRFRREGNVVNKLQRGFDPVTEADRAAEKAIRAILGKTFPDHGILGEEWGAENTDSRFVWVIDPIDGTRAFISGLPLWGTLIGLTDRGDAVAGMMAQPFTGELFVSVGSESHYEGPGGARVLRTRRTRELGEATLCTTTPALFSGELRPVYDKLESRVRLARYGTDCYAYCMLAAGHVDLVVEIGLQAYDIVALIPLIERAGGVITDWENGPAEKGGAVVAAATPELHRAALDTLTSG